MKIKKQLVKEIIELLKESRKGGGSGAARYSDEKDDVIRELRRLL